MVKVTILVCAMGLPQADCSVDTATAVIQGPDVQSAATCGLHGQAYIADTAIADYADEDHYIKLRCTMGDRSTDRAWFESRFRIADHPSRQHSA